MSTVISPKGYVDLQRDYYSCSDVVSIILADYNLAGQGTWHVESTTSHGDSEQVTLTEADATLGVFTGMVSTGSGDPNSGDGILQVSHGQVISVVYEDVNDGTGSPASTADTAQADCEGPVVFNVQVDIPGPEPTVTFETDEPATSSVMYGVTCGGEHITAEYEWSFETSHSLKLVGLPPKTACYFKIEVADALGNAAIDDNNGVCYVFTTTGDDLYVPADYPTIQEAIDFAWPNTTIWVTDGTYTGDGNRDIDFYGKAVTVRSQNGPENCIIDCNGSIENKHRGFYFHNGEDGNSVVDGFTIINGYHWFGGAICCEQGSPTIVNCIMASNTAFDDGGAIFCDYYSSPSITSCTLTGNFAWLGGGIASDMSGGSIENCIIRDNRAEWEGGGVYGFSGSVSYCTISGNRANHGGGGLSDCRGPITYCDVGNNTAGDFGGAMSWCFGPITNCLIVGNTVRRRGGGLAYCDGDIRNCTIIGNGTSVMGEGGGLYNCEGTISNCIIWNNVAREDSQLSGCAIPVYSCIQDWSGEGEGNINNT
jgi:hypothetical protein